MLTHRNVSTEPDLLFCSSGDSNADFRAHLIGAEWGVLDDCEKWGWLREVPEVPKDDNGDGDLQSPAFSDLAKRGPDPYLPPHQFVGIRAEARRPRNRLRSACRHLATRRLRNPPGVTCLRKSEVPRAPVTWRVRQFGVPMASDTTGKPRLCILISGVGCNDACGRQLECPPAHSPWTVELVVLFPSAASVRPC